MWALWVSICGYRSAEEGLTGLEAGICRAGAAAAPPGAAAMREDGPAARGAAAGALAGLAKELAVSTTTVLYRFRICVELSTVSQRPTWDTDPEKDREPSPSERPHR